MFRPKQDWNQQPSAPQWSALTTRLRNLPWAVRQCLFPVGTVLAVLCVVASSNVVTVVCQVSVLVRLMSELCWMHTGTRGDRTDCLACCKAGRSIRNLRGTA